jgi:hypothetical protein
MTREKLRKFILARTEKGWSDKDIAEGLEKAGHVGKVSNVPMTSNAVSVLKSKLKKQGMTASKRSYKKREPKLVSLTVPETPVMNQRLIALMGSPSDVMNAISQLGGF